MPRRNKNMDPEDNYGGLEKLKSDLGLRGRTVGRRPSRGDVWFTDLGKRGLHIQEGTRPVVIISTGAGLARVVPITSNMDRGWMKEHVVLTEADLEDAQPLEPFSQGVALTEQVTTVPDTAFKGYMGRLSRENGKLADIGQALKAVLCLR